MPKRRKRTRAQHGFLVKLGHLRLHVLVYRTFADLRRAAVEVDGGYRQSARTTGAWCKSIDIRHKRTGRRHPIFAAVAFAAEDLRPRYVVHEAFHATLRWAARVGYQYLPLPQIAHERGHGFAPEERMAETCDEICRQIFLKLYELKVWKD